MPTLRCKDLEPDRRCSSISTKAVRDIWLTISPCFSGIVFCSGERITRFGAPSWRAIVRYANCRMRILKPRIFSFRSAISGSWGSTPVVSPNGADRRCLPTGSPHSWISCCRGKRRSWCRGCSDRSASAAHSRHRTQPPFAMQIAQLALEDLAAGLARQRVEEFYVLWHLEIRQPRAQKILHGGGRQRRARLGFDAGEQPFAELVVGNAEHRAVPHAVHADQRVL